MSCEKTSSCDGRCCTNLTISHPWVDVQYRYKKHLLNQDRSNLQDVVKIATMLIPLQKRDGVETYDCRHFNKKTRLCMDYDNRPDMCRRHGIGYPCPSKGCTWTRAVELRTAETLRKFTRQFMADIMEREMVREYD